MGSLPITFVLFKLKERRRNHKHDGKIEPTEG